MRVVFFGFVAVLAAIVPAQASEPTLVIHHQGRLLGSDDSPVSGPVTLTARLWEDQTSEAPVWSETYEVLLNGAGLYAISMGDTAGGKTALSATDVRGERWFSITIDEMEMLPRQRLGVVPHALDAVHATSADNALVADKALVADNALVADRALVADSATVADSAYTAQSALEADSATVADNALALGGAYAEAYLLRAEFDAFKAVVTVTDGSTTTVPWSVLSGVPTSLDTALQTVAVASALAGDGTASSPLSVATGGIATAHLKNQSVTREKLQPCGDGEILKFQGGAWACGTDVGSGSTLSFEVEAPLAQTAGTNGALLRIEDGGIDSVKLADDSIDSQKLGADAASLGKITGEVLVATGDGAVGVGAQAPAARLDVAPFPDAGRLGPGEVAYSLNGLTVTGGGIGHVVRAGDSIRLGTLGWRMVMSVEDADTATIASPYASDFAGNWSYRPATLRAGKLVYTASGELGVGKAAPTAAVDVVGDVQVTGTFKVNGVSAVTPAGAMMHFVTPNCPEGWLKANGQTVSAADHPALAAAFGASDDFQLPDLRGEFVRGLSDGRGVDAGRAINSAQAQDFKSFAAWNSSGPSNAYNHGPVTFAKSGKSGNLFGGGWSAPSGLFSIQWDGSEVRPRNVALLACIKG